MRSFISELVAARRDLVHDPRRRVVGHMLAKTAGLARADSTEDAPRCYLLFAGGSNVPRGGLADLTGTFSSEDRARRAFLDIRLNARNPQSWAQLAVVEPDGIKPLCWFGIGAMPARNARS